MSDHIVVQTTCGSAQEAQALARALVERGHAACVQRIPIDSTYVWEGSVRSDSEVLLLIKAAADRYPDIASTIDELHAYDVPELIVTPIIGGSAAYLDFLAEGR